MAKKASGGSADKKPATDNKKGGGKGKAAPAGDDDKGKVRPRLVWISWGKTSRGAAVARASSTLQLSLGVDVERRLTGDPSGIRREARAVRSRPRRP